MTHLIPVESVDNSDDELPTLPTGRRRLFQQTSGDSQIPQALLVQLLGCTAPQPTIRSRQTMQSTTHNPQSAIRNPQSNHSALRTPQSAIDRWLPLVVLVAITLAELLLTVSDPRVGLLLHVVVLILLLHSVQRASSRIDRRLYTGLLLVPLIRVLSLGLPLAEWPRAFWYVAVSVPLFIAMALIIWLESWRREELGHTLGNLPRQMAIGLTGLGLGWIEYQILAPAPLSTDLSWQASWLPALMLLISTGYLEELLFRGLLQSAAIPVMGYWRALLFVAALFAAMHIGYASLPDVLFVFLVGLAFGVVVARTRSLVGVTLAHGLTNITLFILWPHLLG